MKVVFDTSVLIAAFLKRSFSDRVLRRCLRENFTLYTSKEILDEIEGKLRTKFHVPEAITRAFVSFLKEISIVVPSIKLPTVPKHLKDDSHILACAIKASAQIIVTLDGALLRLKKFDYIVILHPRTLLWTFPERNNTH